MASTFDVSDTGRVRLKLKRGDYVRVGDAEVAYVDREGDSIFLTFEAPRSVPIVRAGQLSDEERQLRTRTKRRRR